MFEDLFGDESGESIDTIDGTAITMDDEDGWDTGKVWSTGRKPNDVWSVEED